MIVNNDLDSYKHNKLNDLFKHVFSFFNCSFNFNSNIINENIELIINNKRCWESLRVKGLVNNHIRSDFLSNFFKYSNCNIQFPDINNYDVFEICFYFSKLNPLISNYYNNEFSITYDQDFNICQLKYTKCTKYEQKNILKTIYKNKLMISNLNEEMLLLTLFFNSDLDFVKENLPETSIFGAYNFNDLDFQNRLTLVKIFLN